jgi:CheY-like chemotaxis protein
VTTQSTLDVNNLVEGEDGARVDFEPKSHLRTSTLPVINAAYLTLPQSSETIPSQPLHAEGKDDNNTQDEPLDEGATPHTQSINLTGAPTKTQYKILLVEDTVELAEVIQATLERLDLHILHETHGNKALEKFNQLDPDVVLLDISLPDTTGWKIMDLIKERLEETKGHMPKVIIITALDDPANRLIGKLQGVYSYIVKPIVPDEVERVVRQALNMDV